MDSYWTGACQRALVPNPLLQRAYTENTDQEIKLLDTPSTQLIQLVKTLRTSSLLFPHSLLALGQHLLYQSPKQLITFFPTCHGHDEARPYTCSNYPSDATSLDFQSHSVTFTPNPLLIFAFWNHKVLCFNKHFRSFALCYSTQSSSKSGCCFGEVIAPSPHTAANRFSKSFGSG